MSLALEQAREDGSRDRLEPRPVDLVHLARYTMGDRALEHEVLTLFARQSDLYLARLRDAGDARAWAEAAHTLKGSARGIGAWGVAEAAERAERCSDKHARAPLIEALAERVAEANRFIEGLLAGA